MIHSMPNACRGLALAVLLLLPAAARAAPAPESTAYTVLLTSHKAGEMTVAAEADGTRRTHFTYLDRGRGPDQTTETRYDASGLPVSIRITGHDYLKAPVDEHFDRSGAQASWSSAADEGSAAKAGYYLPNQATSEDLAALARALLKAPGHELDLVPGGHVRIEQTEEWTGEEGMCAGSPVNASAACADKIWARLYLIHGLAFSPSPIWLDAAGELVFEGSSWLAVVRPDQQTYAEVYVGKQNDALGRLARAQATTLAVRPATPVAITHVSLFDAETRTVRKDMTVVISGKRITAVGPARTTKFPYATRIIDGRGKTLIPGLWDMHVHLSADSDGLLDLMMGVTSVRDLANDTDELLARRKAFDEGELIGPRIVMAGIIEGPGPLAGPTKVLVATPEEARAAVDNYARLGYVQVKIYSSVKPELVPVIVAEAHAKGLRVSGHVPAGMVMRQAVEAGYDEVQHANFWFLNFMGPEVTAKTNSMARFYEVGAHAKDLDLDSPEVNDFVALLKAHHTVVDPTLVAFEDMFIGQPRQMAPSLAWTGDRLPAAVARGTRSGGLATDEATRTAYAQSWPTLLRFTKKLYDAGVIIVPGTDGLAGAPLSHELEDYVTAGIPANQVLYMATLGSARVMHLDKDLGSVAVGKLADLVLIDGDPTVSITDVRKPVLVIKDGTLFDPDALAEAAGVKRRERHVFYTYKPAH